MAIGPRLVLVLCGALSMAAAGCDDGCASDTDCKGTRVCVRSRCTNPTDLSPSPVDLAPPLYDQSMPDDQSLPRDLSGLDLAAPADLATTPADLTVPASDLTSLPSEQDCFTSWRTLGSACPPPTVTASYYTGAHCENTAGWVFEGHYFQFDHPDSSQPVISWGPTDEGSSAYGGRSTWNTLTSTTACVTICVGCGSTIIGQSVWLVNPDGQSSNHVIAGSQP